MQLRDIQTHFEDLLLDEPDAVYKLPEDFASLFDSSDIPIADRLKVYRNNVIGNISDYLVVTFPLLEKLVGEDFLRMMARAFVMQSPPRVGCLQHYGEGFSEFIANYEHAQTLVYLPDMARFEFLMNRAYYAKDEDKLRAIDLSSIPPDQLADTHVNLHSSCFLYSSKYPIEDIRSFCLNPEAEAPNLSQGPSFLLVYRPEFDVHTVRLDEEEFFMLSKMHDGLPLGMALEQTMEKFSAFDIQFFLKKHIEIETFSRRVSNTQ